MEAAIPFQKIVPKEQNIKIFFKKGNVFMLE
jgi:hypothetical protein